MVASAAPDTNAAPISTAEADALFTSRIALAYKIARRYGRRYPWLADDFESDALLTLWTAARQFDPAKAKDFGRFASFKIGAALIDRLRRERVRNPLAFRGQVSPGEDADGGTSDPITLARDRHDDLATLELGEMLAALPPDRGAAVRRYYLDAETHAEVAVGQGVSEQTAGIRVRSGVKLLREVYAA